MSFRFGVTSMADGGGFRLPPSSNRGEKSTRSRRGPSCGVLIDFCSFSFASWHLFDDYPNHAELQRAFDDGDERVQFDMIGAFLADVCGGRLVLGSERRGFLHFYDHHFVVFGPDGKRCGFVAFGGESQRHTVNVQLTGAACAHVEAWAHVALRLSQIGARLTRVDTAFDDLKGVHGLREAEAMYAAGAFVVGGRPPSAQRQGWDDGSGKTLYVGKDRSHQQLCVYEKGREQGARDGDPSSRWVRWEARFGASRREIPVEILTEPAKYMRGQYPALYFVRAAARRIACDVGKAASNLARATRHARQQCGRLLYAVRSMFGDGDGFSDFVNRELVVSKLPDWFAFNPAASPVARVLCAA